MLSLQVHLLERQVLKHEPQRLKNDTKKQSYDPALLRNLWVPFNGVPLQLLKPLVH